jgi:MFS family permease
MVAILEIPSGYFCDLYGRRKTLILGAVFYGIGFTLLAFAKTYSAMLVYELFCAGAFSLASGADIAFLYDQMDETHDRQARSEAIAKIQYSQTTAEAIGSMLGGLLAAIHLRLPFIVQAFVAWMPLLISLSFIENQQRTKIGHQHKENFFKVFRYLWQKQIRMALINLVVWGLATFCSVWILQKYWQESGVPIQFFGILWACFNFTAGITGKNIGKFKQNISSENLLLIAGILPVIAYLAMGTISGIATVLFALFFYLGRGLIQVLLREQFNHYLPDEMRATANSVQSFLFRFTFSLIGPAIGWGIDHYSTKTVLTTLGVIFLLLYFVTLVPYVKRLKLNSI